MKKIVLLSALSTTLLAAFSVSAADTTELKVKGIIRPAACTPSFTGGNVVDYGVIPAKSLNAGQYTTLDTKQITFAVNCEAMTKVAVKFTDNMASSRVTGITNAVTGTKTDAYNYGLGAVDGKNVGGYALSFDTTTTADSKPVKNIFSADGGKTWNSGAADLQHEGQYFSFGDTGNQPVNLTVLSAKINVKTVLNKPENLNLTQDVPLNGSTTIEVKYL